MRRHRAGLRIDTARISGFDAQANSRTTNPALDHRMAVMTSVSVHKSASTDIKEVNSLPKGDD